VKKFLLLVAFAISCFFVYSLNANAYVYVESSNGAILPSDYDITNINSIWDINSGSYYSYNQPWLYSVGQYWFAGSVYGSHINISADYYFGVKGEAFSDAAFSNYLNNTLNTLKSSNLVCGIGELRVGYDSTFAKEITNFNVDYNVHYPDSNGSFQILYHITFNYHQQIKQVNKSNTNMWCVFDRVPTNGLFLQTVTGLYSSSVRYYYYNFRFDWSVTEDATTGAINNLKTEQEKTNQKIDKTNEELGKLNDNLNNDNTDEASNEASEFFSGFETDTFGLTSIITAPLNLISSITSSSCNPLGLDVPFVDSTLSLPCMTNIYERYFGDFLTVYQTITFGIIAYWVCIRIFALVKDFKNPDHDEIEVMDL